METKQKERIRRLMELLKKTDRIHLKDAARMLEVSVMTIRRDLHQEDEPLPLTLLGGYIVMVNKPAPSMPVIHDVPKNHRDDLPIAILAAGMVNENDLIFFDNGRGDTTRYKHDPGCNHLHRHLLLTSRLCCVE